MDDVFAVEVDYEKLIVSLLDENNALMGIIECSSTFQLLEKYSEITRYFMESIKGRRINIHFPLSQKVSPAKKSYGSGNLFMEYSGSEKL